MTYKEAQIINELLALIEAIEHHQRREKSLWLRLTTPDYLSVMGERLKILIALIREGEAV